MRTTFAAALLTATVLAAPAFAQTTIIPMPAAPQPNVSGPAAAVGIPQTPLTTADTKFVEGQLEGNMAEIQIAQLALQKSQDQNIRNYAQKMINDHTAANSALMQISNRQEIQPPTMLTPGDMAALDHLRALNGLAFDTAYINDMIAMHDQTVTTMNDQLARGQSGIINVWVQNTRPVVLQHQQLAQQIKEELPRAG